MNQQSSQEISVSGEPLFVNRTDIQLDRAMQKAIDASPPRGHMGLSSVSNPDMRTTWLNFRWCLVEKISPRKQRIFDIGNMLEEAIIQKLRTIPGLTLHDCDPETGKQFRFSYYGGHVGGSMDGVALGVPEAPKTWHIFEAKSANSNSYKQLIKAGSIEAWNPTYYGQAQNYMGASGLTRALFVVYNKDTSELYFERIRVNKAYFKQTLLNIEDMLCMDGPPMSIYKPTDYRLKNYKSEQYQRVYWGEELPAPNCRNCKHSEIRSDGDQLWKCNRWNKTITILEQVKGCSLHLYMPALFPGRLIEDHGVIVRYFTPDGVEIWNAEDETNYPDAHVYQSDQLHGLSMANMLNRNIQDEELSRLRKALDGRFVAVPQDEIDAMHKAIEARKQVETLTPDIPMFAEASQPDTPEVAPTEPLTPEVPQLATESEPDPLDGLEDLSKKEQREVIATILRDRDIAFVSKRNGIHLVVESGNGLIDFWPGTQKIIPRVDGEVRHGVNHLIELVNLWKSDA